MSWLDLLQKNALGSSCGFLLTYFESPDEKGKKETYWTACRVFSNIHHHTPKENVLTDIGNQQDPSDRTPDVS